MTTRKTMLQKQGMKNSKKDASPFFMPLSRYQHTAFGKSGKVGRQPTDACRGCRDIKGFP